MSIVLADGEDPRHSPEHMAYMHRQAEARWRWLRDLRRKKAAKTPSERHLEVERLVKKRRERFG